MPIVVRALGLLLIVAALAQWRQALQAAPGQLDVVQGVALPFAWGVTGYGLLRLREWGRQLMLITTATWIIVAIVQIVIERSISTLSLVTLILGVNLGMLFISRRVVALTKERTSVGNGEPEIEGWLAAAAALIAFGAVWILLLLPVTIWLWNWFWGLSGGGKLLMFFFAGTYFIGLVYATFATPFFVAGYFRGLAKEELQHRQQDSSAHNDAV